MEVQVRTRAHGKQAEIRWSYYVAAKLTEWSAVSEPGKPIVLTATIESSHPSRLTQQPLTFVVPREKGPWTWPIENLQIVGDQVTAHLIPTEE